ncbi:hypothetical protein HPB50_002140 [Hyalomma asiaticum]|uniref:Uncharacterized protein n=1 Tax=Hyalomma asiaticum TaxID=266040 RepID=A0ACB7RLJ3_HYAAI|nr:hypothetical protein HPB50_002140 [Hyalomma asiaticum]
MTVILDGTKKLGLTLNKEETMLFGCRFSCKMPSNAELAKRLDALEAKLENENSKLTDDILGKFLLKLQSSGLDAVELKKQVENLETSMGVSNDIIEKLRDENLKLTTDNKKLISESKALSVRVAELEQHSRMNNVEVRGVPCTQGEDCIAVMQTIGTKIGCLVTATDFDVAHRVPTKVQDKKNIVARFCSRAKKDEFVSKAHKAKLHLSDIGVKASVDSAVYVNEH